MAAITSNLSTIKILQKLQSCYGSFFVQLIFRSAIPQLSLGRPYHNPTRKKMPTCNVALWALNSALGTHLGKWRSGLSWPQDALQV